ncbi:MAG: MltA domain-containing protein [Bdellovibrionales bacterium]
MLSRSRSTEQKTGGKVFITSYFEPVLEGRLTKTSKYSQPLYGRPKDMTLVDLGEFSRLLPQLEPIKDKVLEQKSSGAVVRGRLVERSGALPKVVPYYDREQIDDKNLLNSDVAEVLAYVDPIDAFFLQIQGSGVVVLPNGKRIRVGYDSQNGHPYVAIGKYLFDVIPRENMSLQAIEEHLRSLPPEQAQAILNKNPSYVFFRKLDSRGITYFGTEVQSGRTIATDYRYFPKGALCLLNFDIPIFESPKDDVPRDWLPVSRLVFDQDTGGAIRGPGRVDLFWGEGEEAKQAAGVMKQPGRLVYLLPISAGS